MCDAEKQLSKAVICSHPNANKDPIPRYGVAGEGDTRED
jgi:hypothetical protein